MKVSTRKSCSQEKIKRENNDDEKTTLVSPGHSIIHGQDGTAFSKVFSDTAVAVKPACTPAHHKKPRSDTNLRVTPLFMEPPR